MGTRCLLRRGTLDLRHQQTLMNLSGVLDNLRKDAGGLSQVKLSGDFRISDGPTDKELQRLGKAIDRSPRAQDRHLFACEVEAWEGHSNASLYQSDNYNASPGGNQINCLFHGLDVAGRVDDDSSAFTVSMPPGGWGEAGRRLGQPLRQVVEQSRGGRTGRQQQ